MLLCAEEFIKHVEKKELYYKVLENTEKRAVIYLPHKKKPYVCTFEGDKGKRLTIRAFLGRVPEGKTARAVICANKINSEYKWVKLFVNDYNDLMAISDTVLNPTTAALYTSELLVDRLIGILECMEKEIKEVVEEDKGGDCEKKNTA